MLASDVEHGGVAKAVLGLRRFFESGGTMSYEFRLGQLKAFQRMLVNERATLQAAMKADLHKNATEANHIKAVAAAKQVAQLAQYKALKLAKVD